MLVVVAEAALLNVVFLAVQADQVVADRALQIKTLQLQVLQILAVAVVAADQMILLIMVQAEQAVKAL
jgi:hypothetical protein